MLFFFYQFNPSHINKVNNFVNLRKCAWIPQTYKKKYTILSNWPVILWVLVCDPIQNVPWAKNKAQRKAQVSDKLHQFALVETFMLWCPLIIFFGGKKKKNFYDLIHTAFSFIMRVRSLMSCHCEFVPVWSEPNHIEHHHEHNPAHANKISTVRFSVSQMFAVEVAKGELTFQWDHQNHGHLVK